MPRSGTPSATSLLAFGTAEGCRPGKRYGGLGVGGEGAQLEKEAKGALGPEVRDREWGGVQVLEWRWGWGLGLRV